MEQFLYLRHVFLVGTGFFSSSALSRESPLVLPEVCFLGHNKSFISALFLVLNPSRCLKIGHAGPGPLKAGMAALMYKLVLS